MLSPLIFAISDRFGKKAKIAEAPQQAAPAPAPKRVVLVGYGRVGSLIGKALDDAGALFLSRGQLELRVNEAFPDPTIRIVAVCEFGKISTLAAATLRSLGFAHATALDGGMKAWREAGLAIEK